MDVALFGAQNARKNKLLVNFYIFLTFSLPSVVTIYGMFYPRGGEMASIVFVDCDPRQGVEQAINSYLENTRLDGQTPRACRALIRKESTGFRFSLTVSLRYTVYHAGTFVKFRDCQKQTRNWQVAVMDMLTRDIIEQVNRTSPTRRKLDV